MNAHLSQQLLPRPWQLPPEPPPPSAAGLLQTRPPQQPGQAAPSEPSMAGLTCPSGSRSSGTCPVASPVPCAEPCARRQAAGLYLGSRVNGIWHGAQGRTCWRSCAKLSDSCASAADCARCSSTFLACRLAMSCSRRCALAPALCSSSPASFWDVAAFRSSESFSATACSSSVICGSSRQSTEGSTVNHLLGHTHNTRSICCRCLAGSSCTAGPAIV